MEFQLKKYQQDCLDTLTVFLRKAREYGDVGAAFLSVIQHHRYLREQTYHQAPGLEGLPYVCLKVPTGGGKTAVAAYAVRPLIETWLQAERGVVLWLAPSDTIVQQTLTALRDVRHPYHRAMREKGPKAGGLTVVNLDGALSLSPAPYADGTVVIVTTIQSMRRRDDGSGSRGREDPRAVRIYRDDNGYLMEHFTQAPQELKQRLIERLGPEADDEEKRRALLPSLRNVLRMHRPLVVVDEAHNARGELSFETLARFDPSAVLEITATPRNDQNVLHQVSAAELKADQMIKLPVELHRREHGLDSIAQAVAKRDELEKLAEADAAAGKGYVRPVVLYHAENKSGDLTPQKVKEVLVEQLKVPAEQVAIHYGKIKNELPDNEVMRTKASPVRHVITVDALREGWDCPFAYVLCSVANLSAKGAVEQLLGRVLRMPYAKERGIEGLNRAYCYATGGTLQAAAGQLEEAIVESGFTRFEAKHAVRVRDDGGPGLWNQDAEPVSVVVQGSVDRSAVPKDERDYLTVAEGASGTELRWTGPAMSGATAEVLSAALPDEAGKKQVDRLRRMSAGEDATPAAMGEPLRLPGLSIKGYDGQLELLSDQAMAVDWDLATADAEIADSSFTLRQETGGGLAIDVTKAGQVATNQIEVLDRQLTLLARDAPQTPQELTAWLGRGIRDPYVVPAAKLKWLGRVVDDQLNRRGVAFETLARNRERLKEAAADKLTALRQQAEATEFQHLLGEASTDLTCCISFGASYPVKAFYEGSYRFVKHYYPQVGSMNKPELEVAQYLDSLPEVKHWVRNPEQRPSASFWLPLEHGKFYPDFVAELLGETYLVVEYKGKHLASDPDELKKKDVGELWAAGSPHELAFVWATERGWRDRIDAAVKKLVGGR